MSKKRKKKQWKFIIPFLILFLGGAAISDHGNFAGNAVSADAQAPSVSGESQLIVTFIDVGQGDSIFIKQGDFAMLIDTGKYAAYDNVTDTLAEYGVTALDYLILTHPDSDHMQSGSDILYDYDVDTVIMPDVENDTETYAYLMEAIEQTDTPVTYAEAGSEYSLGEAVFELCGPIELVSDTNADSVVLRLAYGSTSFLFTGDATGDEIDDIVAAGYDLSADVLKVSHHGSANDGTNSRDFIRTVSPQYAVISCGYENSYGHPHKETMELLQEYQIGMFRTDLQGSVTAYSDGENITWDREESNSFFSGMAGFYIGMRLVNQQALLYNKWIEN